MAISWLQIPKLSRCIKTTSLIKSAVPRDQNNPVLACLFFQRRTIPSPLLLLLIALRSSPRQSFSRWRVNPKKNLWKTKQRALSKHSSCPYKLWNTMNLCRVRNRTQLAFSLLTSTATTTTSFARAFNTQGCSGVETTMATTNSSTSHQGHSWKETPCERTEWFSNPIHPGFDPTWTNTHWCSNPESKPPDL